MEKGRYRIKDRAVGKLNLVLKLSHVRMCMCLFVNSGATMTKESKLSTRLENRQRVRSRGRETRWSWYVETTPIIRLNMLDWILSRERIDWLRVFVPLSKICRTSELSALYFGLEHFSFRCIWRWLKDNVDKGWNGLGY